MHATAVTENMYNVTNANGEPGYDITIELDDGTVGEVTMLVDDHSREVVPAGDSLECWVSSNLLLSSADPDELRQVAAAKLRFHLL